MNEGKRYTADELKEILRLHADWLAGKDGGKRAYLSGAYLSGAYLRSAYLRSADLSGANLSGANLDDHTTLWTCETWRAYLDTVLPQLYVAGGKPLAEVAAAWDCHEWNNCPMHVAFGIDGTDDLSGLPLLLKPRIEQFVQLFDAKLIPKPVVAEEAAA